MKRFTRKLLLPLFTSIIILLGSQSAWGQLGKIKGKVILEDGCVEFAVVKLINTQSGALTGTLTDEQGKFEFKLLEPGSYKLISTYDGFEVEEIVLLSPTECLIQDLVLDEMRHRPRTREVIITEAHDLDKLMIGQIMSDRNPYSLVAATHGDLVQADLGDGIGVRGARASSTAVYVDGVRLRGELQIPLAAMQSIDLLVGSIPAEFGDATGGIVLISTMTPAKSIVIEHYNPNYIILD